MFRNLRTLSAFSRALFRPRSSIFQHDGAVTIRRVRVVRPVFTLRRAQTLSIWVASFSAVFYLREVLDYGQEEEEVPAQSKAVEAKKAAEELKAREDEQNAVQADEEEEDDVDIPSEPPEDSWFIPMGLAHQRPQGFYKGNDPEWQSFVEFSHDDKRNHFVRNELAGLVGAYMGNLPNFQKYLGSPIQTGKYWLVVDFPDGPPPEYERAGLEITDDYIAWTVRPVSPMNVSRLQRALWPTATVSSLWASSQALWQLEVAKLKDFLNIKADPDPDKPRFPPGYMNLPRLGQSKDQEASQSASTAPKVHSSNTSPPASTALPSGSERSKILWPLPSIPKPSTDMATVSTVFKDNLAKNWRSASEPAPRGTFMVSGLVEVYGPKGVVMLDLARVPDSVAVEEHPRQLAEDLGQELDESTTPTPFPTRAHSPVRQLAAPHDPEEVEATMEQLNAIFQQREMEEVNVAVVDGSVFVPTMAKLIYLAIYLLLNLGLTLYNKEVMIKFPFPFFLTALHAGTSFIGTYILMSKAYFVPTQIGRPQYRVLGAFSLLYTVNIAISNLSLSMVTIPFHQTVRAISPVFTVFIYIFFFGHRYTKGIYISLIPVVGGVALAVYGDYHLNLAGLFWTLLGAILASVKTVATNRLQTAGLHLNAIELLYHMSFWAVPQALMMAYIHDEHAAFIEYVLSSPEFGFKAVAVLLSNGAIAFFLNWASFTANKKVGALTMTVAANIKQVLTVVLSIAFWNLQVGLTNAVGIGMTLIGGVLYGHMSMGFKAAKDLEKGFEK
ncbi:UAA transporter [Trapelia coarctata]|nr:UAA transporter [Trapelia coarctata]